MHARTTLNEVTRNKSAAVCREQHGGGSCRGVFEAAWRKGDGESGFGGGKRVEKNWFSSGAKDCERAGLGCCVEQTEAAAQAVALSMTATISVKS
jgi:hypothetical protein